MSDDDGLEPAAVAEKCRNCGKLISAREPVSGFKHRCPDTRHEYEEKKLVSVGAVLDRIESLRDKPASNPAIEGLVDIAVLRELEAELRDRPEYRVTVIGSAQVRAEMDNVAGRRCKANDWITYRHPYGWRTTEEGREQLRGDG